jgi:hypothetical protein
MKAEMRRLSDENRLLKLQLSSSRSGGDISNSQLQLSHQQMPQMPSMRAEAARITDAFTRDPSNFNNITLGPSIAHSASDESESGIDNSSIRPSTNYERKTIHTRKRRRANSKEDFAEAANFFFDANTSNEPP